MHAESLQIERSSSKPLSSEGDGAAHPLFAALQRYEFDEPGASFTFEARLARENGWTRGYARRVIEEYRRFVFLAMVSEHPVTPSEQVDQAWHLHLTFTRKYWEELCGRVLPRPLHHNPTRGGAAEGAKFVDWYERTRGLYRSWFGSEPPADIWPTSATRFGHDVRWARVNTQDHWVVRKPSRRARVTFGLAAIAAAGAGGLMLAAMGAGPGEVADSVNAIMPQNNFRKSMMFAVIATIIALVMAGMLARIVMRRPRATELDRHRQPRATVRLRGAGGIRGAASAQRAKNSQSQNEVDDASLLSPPWSLWALLGWGATTTAAPVELDDREARRKNEEGGCGGAGCGGGSESSNWPLASGAPGPSHVAPTSSPATSQPASNAGHGDGDGDSGGDAGGSDAGGGDGGGDGGCGGGGCGGGGCGGGGCGG